jgi:hypothetical protein
MQLFNSFVGLTGPAVMAIRSKLDPVACGGSRFQPLDPWL